MRLITLTNYFRKSPIYVNADRILAVYIDSDLAGKTRVDVGDLSLSVTETPEHIVSVLELLAQS